MKQFSSGIRLIMNVHTPTDVNKLNMQEQEDGRHTEWKYTFTLW